MGRDESAGAPGKRGQETEEDPEHGAILTNRREVSGSLPASSLPAYTEPVPVVTLRSPLRDLAGGTARVAVDGSSVGEALVALERAHPPISGWILDEHGRIRAHVNVFVDGRRAGEATPVDDVTELHVLSAISGGGR